MEDENKTQITLLGNQVQDRLQGRYFKRVDNLGNTEIVVYVRHTEIQEMSIFIDVYGVLMDPFGCMEERRIDFGMWDSSERFRKGSESIPFMERTYVLHEGYVEIDAAEAKEFIDNSIQHIYKKMKIKTD